MVDITNPSNNLSYTEKDFQTIYPALLDLVKKLTLKWDPSISNESDPGVILLKLDAILGDKLDYNIDKNVLETFPASVTQLKNARQLYSQMGYEMKWYNAGTTKIGLAWKGEKPEDSGKVEYYKIPQFTMVSDDEDSIVFTLLDNNIQLAEDGTPFSANAIQGVVTDYTINDETLITAVNLDNEKKLHFVDYNVAENGIYICDAGNTSNDWLDTWKRVDNLNVEEFGQKIYRFGIDQAAGTCYIQFPDDIESLIGQGIYIKYILTSGSEGNIKAQLIDKLYHNISVPDPHNPENTVELNVDNIKVNNQTSVDDGTDPEDIEEAYEGYKRTVGTFNTLVSLRDYFNYIVENNLVSNVIVCDRTNDPQTSYNIITSDGDIETTVNQRTTKIVEREAKEGAANLVVSCKEPSMEPFELKLYCLQNIKGFRDNGSYENSFIVDSIDPTLGTYGNVVADIDSSETKHIQHDFDTLDPLTTSTFTVETKDDTKLASGYMYFINSYPIVCKIIPTVELTKVQQTEVKSNVLQALRDSYNASKMEFGKEPDYQEIEKTIENADSRIKIAILNDFEYTTYVVYYSNGIKVEKLEDHSDIKLDILAKSILAGVTPLFTKGVDLTYLLNQSSMGKAEVGILSTNVDVNFDNSSPNYVMRDNESIVMYAPNLVDKTVYSTYTRFQYNIGEDVPANTSYQLKQNESIVFYWKESDEEEAYHYYFYSGDVDTSKGEQRPIIKSSFTLAKSEWIDNKTTAVVNDVETYKYYTGSIAGLIKNTPNQTTANVYMTVNILKSKLTDQSVSLTEYIANDLLADSLSGTKKIIVQELNKAEVKQSYYMYWITNNKEETKNADGTKTITYSIDFDENNEYLLKANEIFMYTDATISGIVSLGEGTKLVLTPTDSSTTSITWTLKTPEISVSDLLDMGFTTDNSSSWARMVSTSSSVQNTVIGKSLTVVEQQLASASTKETVSFTPSFSNVPWKVSFSSNEHCEIGVLAFAGNGKYIDTYYQPLGTNPRITQNISQITPSYIAGGVKNFCPALDKYGQPFFVKYSDIAKNHLVQPFPIDTYTKPISEGGLQWIPCINSGKPYLQESSEEDYNKATDKQQITGSANVHVYGSSYSVNYTPLIALPIEDISTSSKYKNGSVIKVSSGNNVGEGTISYWRVVIPDTTTYFLPQRATIDKFNIKVAGTELSNVNIEGASWDGFSVLNLNMGPEKPQELLSGQSISWKDGNSVVTIEGGDSSDQGNPFVISDQELVRYGGKNIDIHYYDADEKERTPILYWYRNTKITLEAGSTSLENTITSSNTRIVLNIPVDGYGTYKISSKLPAGNYVLPIYISANGFVTEIVKPDDWSYLSGTIVPEAGGNYFRVGFTEDSNLKSISIVVDNTHTGKPQTIIIDNLIPYTDFQGDDVLKAVQTLDVDDVFNYAHIVDDDILIEDPTQPISFFDKNHIFNKYTIAKIDTNQFDKVTLSNRTFR